MASKVVLVVVLVWCCMCHCLPYTQVDVLFLSRCKASCGSNTEKQKCELECLMMTKNKPGQCPNNISRKFDRACINACSRDTECPGIEKCCSHNCGVTCQAPVGLELVQGLPSIPENITMLERGKPRSAIVKWQTKYTGSTPVIYVVEERHHAGKDWVPANLGSWTIRNKTNKTRCLMKNLVPGHWYQMRVASINENGSRGFSEPSWAFSLTSKPKTPKMPNNLTVSRLGWLNGTLYGLLSWDVPESDLPIQWYKVFWSSLAENTTEKSVCIQQATISSKDTSYILKKLEPHSLYFLQVQALSQYGKKRLKSDKRAIFLNAKLQKQASYNWKSYFNNQHKYYKSSGNQGLNYTRFFWGNEKLHCHVEWKSQSASSRYLLTWTPTSSCMSTNHETEEATTETTSFDIYGLKFDCKYKIVLQEANRHTRKLGTIDITTPRCKTFSGFSGKHTC